MQKWTLGEYAPCSRWNQDPAGLIDPVLEFFADGVIDCMHNRVSSERISR
jgi:hypothetical protein